MPRKSIELSKKLNEIRRKINAINILDDPTTEQVEERSRLNGEFDTVSREWDAAVTEEAAAEGVETRETNGGDAETRERERLRGEARIGRYVEAQVNGRPVDGVEAELNAAYGLPAGQAPLALLGPVAPRETRAITAAPSTAPVQATRPTVPYVFQRSMAARLGILFPTVEPGQANFPQLTTAPPAAPVAKDGSAPATAGAFTLATRTAKRITGEFEVRVEDLAIFPSMEDDLRRALGDSLSNQTDEQVIAGNGTAPNLTGLFKVATDVSAESNTVTFATGMALFGALVDGRYANGYSDLRAIVGSDTFAAFDGHYQSNGDVSLYDRLMAKLGYIGVSNRVPAAASDAQKILVVRGGEGTSPIVVPVWSGMDLIVNPYSGAGEGKRTITVTALVGDPFVPHGTDQVVELHPKIG